MMKFFRNVFDVTPYLNITLLVAILSILLMEAYLKDVPENVAWGAEFGVVFYKLCLSIMASYIFYFIVVHLKSQSDKENINAFVATKSYRVVGEYKSQIQEIKKATNTVSGDEFLTKNEIQTMFQSINPKNNAPLILGQLGKSANWIQYMAYHKERTQKLVQKIFVKMPFLDSELVRLLAEIDDCSHFGMIESTLNMQFKNGNMSAWASTFYDYSVKCKELQKYNEKKLAHYKP